MVPPAAGRGVPLLASLLLLVVVTRVAHYDDSGLWEDEAFGYFIAVADTGLVGWAGEADPPELHLTATSAAGAPGSLTETHRMLRVLTPWGPLYYDLLHLARSAVSPASPTSFRLINVAFAVATAVGLWRLAGGNDAPLVATLAILLFAFSAWDLDVGLQLKGYALTACCAVWSSHLLLRLPEAEGRAPWFLAGYATCAAVGLLTHLQMAWLILVHGAYLAFACRSRLPGFALASAAAAAPVGLWLTAGGGAQAGQVAGYFHHACSAAAIGRAAMSSALHVLWPLSAAGGMLHKAIAVAFLFLVLAGATGLPSPGAAQRRIARLAGFAFGGVLLLAGAAALLLCAPALVWPRYLTPVLPLAWLAAGLAVAGSLERVTAGRPRLRRVGTWSLLVTAIALLVPPVFPGRLPLLDRANDWRAGAGALDPYVQDGDLFVHLPAYAAFLAFAGHWHRDTWHRTARLDDQGRLAPASAQRLAPTTARPRAWVLLSWTAVRHEATVDRQMRELGWLPARRLSLGVNVALGYRQPGAG